MFIGSYSNIHFKREVLGRKQILNFQKAVFSGRNQDGRENIVVGKVDVSGKFLVSLLGLWTSIYTFSGLT